MPGNNKSDKKTWSRIGTMFFTHFFIESGIRLPCQRELVPQASEGLHSRHFLKVQPHVESWKPAKSPRLGRAEAPPFGKGGFGCYAFRWYRHI